jgi:hypothetical protein
LTALIRDLDDPTAIALRGQALALQGQVFDHLGRRGLR